MKKSITDKGNVWEFSKIWWLIFLSFFFLGWISFLFIGIKTKTKKWIIEGIVYCLILHTSVAFSDIEPVSSFFAILMMFGWFVSIVRIFIVRKEYLLRRVASDNLNKTADEELKRKIETEYANKSLLNLNDNAQIKPIDTQKTTVFDSKASLEATNIASTTSENTAAQNTNASDNVLAMLDINSCDESSLSSLPGISVAMAKKAISHREEIGGFNNMDDFFNYLELKPHIIIQLEGKIKCEPLNNSPSTKQKGRILDI